MEPQNSLGAIPLECPFDGTTEESLARFAHTVESEIVIEHSERFRDHVLWGDGIWQRLPAVDAD